MAGFGSSGDEVPVELQGVMDDVWYWRNINPGGAPTFGWALYHAGTNSQPVEDAAPDGQMWGPEAEFARQFRLAHPTTPLFLVKNSMSGAQLEKSEVFLGGGAPSNDWHPDSTGELYDGTQGMVAAAIAAMDSGFDVVDFNTLVLWMQGEADAAYAVTAPHYYGNLGALIAAIRAEWGLGASAPFIAGRIQPLGWTYNGPVRHAFARTAVDLAAVKMVSTDDLPLLDGIHYNSLGQQGLGLKFWQAYANTRTTVAIALPSTFGWTIEEQPGNGTIIGTIAPSNSPDPTPTFDLLSGETAGFAVDANTGVLTVSDGSQLVFATDASRVFTVRVSNGINTVTTTVTVTLTESTAVTDIAGRLARFDPNNASFYTLDAGNYSLMLDTYGNGRSVEQGIGNKPTQATFPGTSKNSLSCDSDSLYKDPNASMWDDNDEEAVLACVVRPVAGPSGGKIFIAILSGFADCRLTLFYDYSASKFGFHCLNTLGSLNTMTTTATFAVGNTYRVVLKKAGTAVTIWVNEVEQATSSHGDLAATILSSGQTGGFTIAGQGVFGGEFNGFIGLCWFIKGNPSGPEMAFLHADLSSWLAAAASSLLTNLVSYWKLDEASGVRADAHGSNNLADNNTVLSADGGADFEADSSEYLSIADNASLSTGDIDFTFACWFKLESIAGYQALAMKGWSGGGTQREWVIYYATDATGFEVGQAGSQYAVSQGDDLTTGTWHFVVVWHDSVNNLIGIQMDNGTPVTQAHAAGVNDGTQDFVIGASPSQGLFWDGIIKKAGFWKRLLTADEKTELFSGADYPFS